MTTQLPVTDRDGDTNYRAPRAALQISDFDIVGRLGDGSFSTVILAKLRDREEQYAIKIVNKHLVLRNKMAEYIRNERNILDQLNYDGIVKLLFTFQDPDSLYFGCEYCPGGDLYEQITQRGKLSLDTTRFYTAEVVLTLEYLRTKQIVHRDLKPENLLLTAEGHLKLSDFGSAKAFFLPPTGGLGKQARATSFVGTAEYVSPEVLNNTPLSYPADLWALGSCVFQMLTGKPPFKAGSEYLTFQKVAEREFEFPEDFPAVARDLVDQLLQLEPEKRLGAQDLADLKAHPFFHGIIWETLRQQEAPAYIPPSGPTPELEGLDWEVTSLVRDTMHVTPVMDVTPATAATNTTNTTTTTSAPAQGQQSTTQEQPARIGAQVQLSSNGDRLQGSAEGAGHSDGGRGGGEFGWAGPCAEGQGAIVYVRNPDAGDSSEEDEDSDDEGVAGSDRRGRHQR